MRELLLIIAAMVVGVACAFAFVERPAARPLVRPAWIAAPARRAVPSPATATQRPTPFATAVPTLAPAPATVGGAVFLNTYYDFPEEPAEPPDTTLYDARCAPIATVPRSFHDRLCVQGSGRIASGVTVSFAARDCACAEICPRTGQRICYDALDRERFPHGRGATGRAITPLRTVAVDPAVIPLGTPIYIPELEGLPRPDGTHHDGCFLAEDEGIKVKGRRVDVFAGDTATRRLWDAAVPSNRGVHVVVGDARCGVQRRDRITVAHRRGG